MHTPKAALRGGPSETGPHGSRAYCLALARCRKTAIAGALTLFSSAAQGAALAAHEAVYDLSLVSQTDELQAVNGRIAFQLRLENCNTYAVDYRFVARFTQASEILVTDQQTLANEDVAGTSFDFETKTFVDGSPQDVVRGRATNFPAKTEVVMSQPEPRTFDLPRSYFILGHTEALLKEARAGRRIVELQLFDGDPEAEKQLSTTAVIAPLGPRTGGEPGEDKFEKELSGLERWRVDESYFNSDSDPDGTPVFRTRYILYENGVSDDLTLDYGDYALQGSLSRLSYGAVSSCP